MHASLPDLKYRSPPSLMLHRHRVPLFAFQSLLCSSDALAHSCDSHHSDVSAVPILGCPRRLLLLLFIKLDSAPKCGVAWFIMKDFLSWILLRIILWLVVCIMPTPIKIVNQSWTCLQLKHILFKYMWSSTFMELPRHLDMHLILCSERLIVISFKFFSIDSFQLVKSDREKKCIGIINDAHHPYSCGEVCIWASKQMVPQSVLVGASF
jgi:hypothetical protein